MESPVSESRSTPASSLYIPKPEALGQDRLYIFFIANYFAQGMVGLAYVPIFYLLKDVLALDASASASFAACMSLPFVLKPFLGLLTDGVPLAGRRRVPYLLLTSFATAACWALLAAMPAYGYWRTLLLLTAVNVGIAFTDVLCDAVMVEHGKKRAKTGFYQAAQIGTLYATLLATGLGGGWLAEHATYRQIFAWTALFPLLIFAATFLVPESAGLGAATAARETGRGLASLLRSRAFWVPCLIIFLYNFTPFQGTAFFYYQSETLGFSPTFIGALDSVGGLAGVAGAAAFWRLAKARLDASSWDTRRVLRACVLAGGFLTLLHLGFRGPASALALTFLFGAAGVVMKLAIMDLAARSCPAFGEATSFALYMSVFNLAAWSSNTAGGKLYALQGGGYGAVAGLVLLSALATAACWPLLSRLPLEREAAAA